MIGNAMLPMVAMQARRIDLVQSKLKGELELSEHLFRVFYCELIYL